MFYSNELQRNISAREFYEQEYRLFRADIDEYDSPASEEAIFVSNAAYRSFGHRNDHFSGWTDNVRHMRFMYEKRHRERFGDIPF